MGGIFTKMFSFARCFKLAPLVVYLFFAPPSVDAFSRSYFGRTTDPTPVHISVQDKNEIVHFAIPKVFMTFSENWDGGTPIWKITLEVIYPSMTALSASRNSTVGTDVIIVNLQSFAYTGADYSMSKLLPILIATQWTFAENITSKNGRSYRLYVNKEDVEKRKDEFGLHKEFLVPDDGGTYFECVRELSNPLVGCSGFVNYGETLSLRFQFKRIQFDKWPEIREAVFKLLDLFRQRAGPQ